MFDIGMPELLVILVILLIIFGPSQVPRLARGLGESLKEFRNVGKELGGALDDDKKI